MIESNRLQPYEVTPPYPTYPSEMVLWPEKWPIYKQACFSNWEDRCRVLIGPCNCGAWHQLGEFRLVKGILYRYNKIVPVLMKEIKNV